MNPRLKKLRKRLNSEDLDGILISTASNITYLTGYQSRDSYLLVTSKESIYFTDSRYSDEAKAALKNSVLVRKTNSSVFHAIAESCLCSRLKRVGFESRHLPFAEAKKIEGLLQRRVRLIATSGYVETLRMKKDPQELVKIREAVRITEKALRFAQTILKAGRKELEIAGELERFIRYHGASNAAFGIIVASGPHSAYPHHITSQRKLTGGEPVMIDIGVEYLGYKSDLTRVFFLGKINPLARIIYEIVLSAQQKALEGVKPGVPIKEVDRLARSYIAQKGYGERFEHNLGHGVGLDTHEEPAIAAGNSQFLQAGMVFTVEPAIYLPRKFGIRIEDIVAITQKGCEVLSGSLDK